MLAGVCAGAPAAGGPSTGALRALFCLAALCGGIGIVVYVACWLVLPEAAEDPHAAGVGDARGTVVLAWATGGLVGLLGLAGAGAGAAAVGLGWVVLALACALAVAAFAARHRIPSLTGLLAVAALALPATAVALSPVRIALGTPARTVGPRDAGGLTRETFRSGFDTSVIDLRRTAWPASGSIDLHIDAGLRRTIVALPADRCVRVRVVYDVHTFVSQLATLLSGHAEPPLHAIVLFGAIDGATAASGPRGVATGPATRPGPLLTIDFSSLGGGLFVRDYPDGIDPDVEPNWPGFPVHVEPRPRVGGLSRRLRRYELSSWRGRRTAEIADGRRIDPLIPGPCAR